jgi:hypothetical protein
LIDNINNTVNSKISAMATERAKSLDKLLGITDNRLTDSDINTLNTTLNQGSSWDAFIDKSKDLSRKRIEI